MRKTSFLFLLSLLLLCACGKRERMEELLCKAEQMNQKYLPLDTVTFMDEVLDYYEAHGNREERQRANYIMGSIYRDRGNSPMALQYFLQAANLADTTRPDCDFQKLNRIYAQMAIIFHQQRYPQKELEMWHRAASMAEKAGDTLAYCQYVSNMSGAYNLMGDSVKLLSNARSSYQNYLKIGRKDYAASSLGAIILHHLQLDSLVKSKKEIDEYVVASGLYDRNKDDVAPGKEIFYYMLGLYYEKSGNTDSSLWYYRNLIRKASNISHLENGYKGLMSTYLRLGLADSAAKYAKLYADANDTANIRHSADEVSRVQSLYDYTIYQEQALLKSKEAKMLLHIIYVGFIVVLLGAFATYRVIVVRRTREKERMKAINESYAKALEQLYSATKELNAYEQDKTKFEAAKQEEVDQLKRWIASCSENCNVDEWEIEQELMQHPVIKSMRKHVVTITQPTPNEWKDLIGAVKTNLPDFYEKLMLHQDKLSEKELYVSILIRINFIPSEISVLMNFSKQRVSNIRSSINKKLFKKAVSKSLDYNIHHL